MLRFAARRLAMLVLTLLIASFAIYAALSIAPGDPLSVLTGGRTLPPGALSVLRARYHLHQPPPAPYWHWLTRGGQGGPGGSIAPPGSGKTPIRERAGGAAGV